MKISGHFSGRPRPIPGDSPSSHFTFHIYRITFKLEPTPKSKNKMFTAKPQTRKEHKFNYIIFSVFFLAVKRSFRSRLKLITY
jgi:hypothetical protein